MHEYTKVLRESLGRTLEGQVGDEAWEQAMCSVKDGGLGFSAPEALATPAFVASRVTARPGAVALFQRLEQAGLAPPGLLVEAYDARTRLAIDAVLANCPEGHHVRDHILDAIHAAGEAAQASWDTMEAGAQPDRESAPRTATSAAGLLDEDEAGQDLSGVGPLQRRITRLLDSLKLEAMKAGWLQRGDWKARRRLAELQDPDTDHQWVTALNPELGGVLAPDEWTTCIRMRIGAPVLSSARVCAACGENVLDTLGYHALCCAKAESTKGHYAVRNALAKAFVAGDPATELETEGLIPSAPTLRPADILTQAGHPHKIMAVDVMVKCPYATAAGHDCAENGKREKINRYAAFAPELDRQGIWYAPAVFSSFGRRHPDVTTMLHEAARRVARRQGTGQQPELVRRWYRTVTAEVWSRAARMVHRCIMPVDTADEEFQPPWEGPPGLDGDELGGGE